MAILFLGFLAVTAALVLGAIGRFMGGRAQLR